MSSIFEEAGSIITKIRYPPPWNDTVKVVEGPNLYAEYLLSSTFSVLDSVVGLGVWVVAFSGGKDSSLLLRLVYEWARARVASGQPVPGRVWVLFNDTGSELPSLYRWVEEYVGYMTKLFNELGVDLAMERTEPEPGDRFADRVVGRGYPAPNFRFRWCVELLKIRPSRRALDRLASRLGRIVLLVGLREDESSARAAKLRRSTCGGGMTCLQSFYIKTDLPGVTKVAPIKHWREEDVWAYLNQLARREPIYGKLLAMYGKGLYYPHPVRFGCWHCTLVKTHHALEVLKAEDPETGEALDCARRLLRAISDDPAYRVEYPEKPKGKYSRLGPLNQCGKTIAARLIHMAEKAIGKPTPPPPNLECEPSQILKLINTIEQTCQNPTKIIQAIIMG